MSDSEEDGDVFSGLARPVLTASTLVDEDDEEEERKAPTGNADQAASESEVDDASGLVGAEAAFDFDTAPEALELDPFRMAGPIQGASTSAPSGEKMKGGKDAQHGKQMTKKIFVGGLPWDLGDAGLVKFFVRFGKVQEASVVYGEDGKSRGFGFVTFMNHKGAKYCISEAGDPPQHTIGGRACTVRFAQDKGNEVPHYKMPARGQYRPEPAKARREQRAPGGVGVGALAPRGADGHGAPKRPPGEEEGEEGAARSRKARKKKEEIVKVSKRQDAEPLYDKPITMRELFPKEFWRV